MMNKANFPGQYIQGKGILNALPEIADKFGKKGLILASKTVINTILPETIKNQFILDLFCGECCEIELQRIAKLISDQKIDHIIGMGGGKTIDSAKIAADRADIPVLIVPTTASTDAPCSGCAVIYSKDGIFQEVQYQRSNPNIVLVDMDIISNAPVRFLVSGMGDALATWFEARSCDRTKSQNECGGISTLAGLHISKLCYETLMKYGIYAKIANEMRIITPALNYIVEANILLSGIGFESSGLASAHAIHNGLTSLVETHAYYHGEKVAFGVLAGLHLTNAIPKEIEEVYSFCEGIGLPTILSDIGLSYTEKERIMQAAKTTCLPEQSIYHEAGIITPLDVYDALIMADAYGRTRKISMND